MHLRPVIRGSAPARRAGAFTLIELVLVIGILAIVGAIAIPRFAGATTRYRLDLAAARLEADARLTSDWARAAGQSHAIVFDADADTYSIVVGTDSTGTVRSTVSLSQSPYQCDLSVVTLSVGGASLVYDGFGRVRSGATVRLRVGDRDREIVLSDGAESTDSGASDLKLDTSSIPAELVSSVEDDEKP